MSNKTWVFEITYDTTNIQDETQEYIELQTGDKATKDVRRYLEIALYDALGIDSKDVVLKSFVETDFTGNEGNEELLKGYDYLK